MGAFSWLDILTSPIRFTRQAAANKTRLRLSLTIFGVFLISRTIGQYLLFVKMLGQLPPSIRGELGWAHFGFSVSLVASGISDVVFWFLGAGILVCLAILLDGMGEYRKLLELTGYAHLPLAIFGVAALVFGLTYTPNFHFTNYQDTDFQSLKENNVKQFESKMKRIESTLVQETSSRKFTLFKAAKHCGYLWTVILFILALRESFGLTLIKSSIAVGGVVLLYSFLEITRQIVIGSKAI